MKTGFDRIEDVIDAYRNGEIVVLTDDENRENEGDLVVAAVNADSEHINFMAKHGRGLICVPVTHERASELRLSVIDEGGGDRFHTAFTMSVDARDGVTTGISAFDRARTVQALINPEAARDDFMVPGHVFPLVAKPGGVLQRAGHTEAAVDLAKLAGLYPAAVICEIMNEDGSMARLEDLDVFRQKHRLKWCSIKDIIAFRRKNERLITLEQKTKLPTRFGMFTLYLYRSLLDDAEHLALVYGDIGDGEDVLVRVHSECLTGDVFHSARCDCGEQLEEAMRMISEEGRGAVIYMRQEGRGIGLANKIHAYRLQDEGLDTVDANEKLGFPPDLREYGLGAQMLMDLNIHSVRLLTNNPRKIVGIEGYGISIRGREPIVTAKNEHNRRYLDTKKERLGHIF